MYRLLINGKLLLAILLVLFVYIYFSYITKHELQEIVTTSIQAEATTSREPTRVPTQRKFGVFDHECKIPRIDPFSADVMAIFKPPKLKDCVDQPDLFTVRYDKLLNQYILRFNKPLFMELFPNVLDYACVFYQIVSGPREPPSWNKDLPVACRDWIVPRHISGIVVECHEIGNRSRILQRDAFPLVQYPVGRNEKNDEERSRINPSVIMLGIDSMSQMNFQRTMPLTAQFVRQLGWYEMLGYNTVSNKVVEGMLSLLSGKFGQQWQPYCDVRRPGCLDALTYLWNHFHNSGYLTAFAEDSPTLNFTRKPVDYYLYPILEAFRQIMEGVKRVKDDYCLGRKQSFRYVLESCLQVVQRFMHETQKPLFGLFWTKSFSHEDFSAAARVDEDFVKYLELYREHGLFKKAVVILFSLHGQRKGPLMKLASGFLEERLPMLHIYLPPWYRKQYPEIAHALDVNRRRLCSTTDLHLTIKDLLLHAHPNLDFEIVCRSCMSLLYVVPRNRSCAQASIAGQFCACRPCARVPESELVQLWAKIIVFRINQYLYGKNHVRQCHHLQLERLLTVDHEEIYNVEGQMVEPVDGTERYQIKFITQPKAVFLGNIFISNKYNFIDVPQQQILRLDAHGRCLDESVAHNLCVCRSSL
ncbi:uncharacterized protein LOC111593784 [Drosophila hydei]|uniref:Uncharacterized protein LOC111593784 n=1 Tax=Drosophila hydei TaxID=7224 RepID=A0A6J1L7L5_DROHY|nr:uncharacterized protein LOC111593784 [Drosophila hydei]